MTEKKYIGKTNILKELYYSGEISCADLSEKINKSLPNTMMQLTDLVEKKVVVEGGYAPSTGGRRPLMYSLKHDFMYVLAVAVDQFSVRIGLTDMHNNPVSAIEKIEFDVYHNQNMVQELSDMIEAYIIKSGFEKKRIAGIGVGVPGFVDFNKGINYSIIDSKSITKGITEKTGIRSFVDNDSSLIALAELKFGVVKNAENAMVINIGWGVGLGLILDGGLFRGSNGFAGEFSHIPLFANNKRCSCGKYGCLETEASLFVIVEKAKSKLLNGGLSSLNYEQLVNVNIEEAFELIRVAAFRGDKFAIELFSEAGYNIGRGVAILIHVLNPDVVILSGRGSVAGKVWQAPIQQAVNEHSIPRLAENTEIKISKLGHNAELIGAAALVVDRLSEDEINSYFTANQKNALVG
ncbi:MAG TPA: ROK family protein [Puia sp.]|nr:ROK family protein [Puia sp.]